MEWIEWIAAVIAVILLWLFGAPQLFAALTANREVDEYLEPKTVDYAVKAATHIYKGSFVGLDPTGYARAYVVGDWFAGIAAAEADNSAGAAAAIRVNTYTEGDYELAVSGATIDDIGAPVYAADSGTLSLSPSNAGPVGYVADYVSSGIARVKLTPGLVVNDSQEIVRMVEVDCQTGQTPQDVVMVPAVLNRNGMYVVEAAAVVTEQFVGATQDQGIVTLKDTDDTTTSMTLTAADASADAIGDKIGPGGVDDFGKAADGDAIVVVAAAKGLKAVVTQVTSGTGAAGKFRIYVRVVLA